MDIVTQGLLGSAVAVSGAKQSEIRQAAWIGALAGLLADADVFISSDSDPLLLLEFHRHFTHALIFIPLGALIAASLIWLALQCRSKSQLTFGRVYYYSFLGYMLSGVLDACTSYGTNLFWPFVDNRVSWSLVSIVDPVFSGALLLGLIAAIKSRHLTWARAGLSISALYLVFSFSQSQTAQEYMAELATSRGHNVERFVVKPTFGNVLLWRTVYLSEGMYYIDAIRPLFGKKIYQGPTIAALDLENDFPQINKTSVQYADILRFNYFSNDFTVISPEQGSIIGDVRYSMFPLNAAPLWGIEINPDTPNKHVKYLTFRNNDPDLRKSFIDMVLGKN